MGKNIILLYDEIGKTLTIKQDVNNVIGKHNIPCVLIYCVLLY